MSSKPLSLLATYTRSPVCYNVWPRTIITAPNVWRCPIQRQVCLARLMRVLFPIMRPSERGRGRPLMMHVAGDGGGGTVSRQRLTGTQCTDKTVHCASIVGLKTPRADARTRKAMLAAR